MSLVTIFYALNNRQLSSKWITERMVIFPDSLKLKANRFINWQDRQAFIFGKLLLAEAVKTMNVEFDLSSLSYSRYGRPHLSPEFDFNISHSGEYVVCAFSKDNRIGVDIELMINNDLSVFKPQFSERDWRLIMQAEDQIKMFYQFWTRKEATVKANGAGLNVPLKEIDVSKGVAKINGDAWYLTEISLDPRYAMHLATSSPESRISLLSIDFF